MTEKEDVYDPPRYAVPRVELLVRRVEEECEG